MTDQHHIRADPDHSRHTGSCLQHSKPTQKLFASEGIDHASDYLKTETKEMKGNLPAFFMTAASEAHHLHSIWIQPAELPEGEMCSGPPLLFLSYLWFWPCLHTHCIHDHVFCRSIQRNKNRFFFFTRWGSKWYVGYFALVLFIKKAILSYFYLKNHHLYNQWPVIMSSCFYMAVFGDDNRYSWSLIIQMISENKTSTAGSS